MSSKARKIQKAKGFAGREGLFTEFYENAFPANEHKIDLPLASIRRLGREQRAIVLFTLNLAHPSRMPNRATPTERLMTATCATLSMLTPQQFTDFLQIAWADLELVESIAPIVAGLEDNPTALATVTLMELCNRVNNYLHLTQPQANSPAVG